MKIIACLVCFCMGIYAFAGSGEPDMRHYTVSDGLPSLEVHCIFQDSRGKIWFGTDAGVSCYDGNTFINYTTYDGLADHTIFGIIEDNRGWIWFRAYNGLLSYFDGSRVVKPAINEQLRQALKNDMALSLDFDAHDTIWIGSTNKRRWIKIPPALDRIITENISGSPNVTLRELRPGHLAATASPSGGTRWRLILQPLGAASHPMGKMRYNVQPYASARLAGGDYLVQFDKEQYWLSRKTAFFHQDSLVVTCIYPEKNGDYWLCGRQPGGARCIRPGKGLLAQYLRNYHVTSCLRDHEGGLWLGTLENGVFYVPFPEMHNIYRPALETGDRITALARYPGGGVLAGTLRGSFFLVHKGSCNPWTGIGIDMHNLAINTLNPLGNTILIGATRDSRIYNCDTRSSILLNDPFAIPGKTFTLTVKCAVAYDDTKWCVSSIRSLYWVDRRTGTVSRLLDTVPERICSIARSRGDTLWLGGISRLWMFVPGQDPVDWSTRFPILSRQGDELISDTASNRLWMLSRGSGVYAIDPGGVSGIHDVQSGLPLICRKLMPYRGALWIATRAGLWKMDSRGTLQTFDHTNGLPTSDIDFLCTAADDRIWLSGNNMLFSIDPRHYPHNNIPPQVCFRDIFCNGKMLDARGPASSADFRYDENTFRFRLAGQSFKSCGHPRFMVRLIGIDNDWYETEQTDIIYYGLPPGDYRFEAYALNNNGVRSLNPVSYAFFVLPPFWKRTWFISLMTVMVITGTIILTRNYLLRFRREETYRRRLAELEITAIRAQMDPHFIFNSINSIYNVVLTGDRTSSATYVARFARLIRNVLEFAPLKQIPLEQELETLRLYMDIEQLRFKETFTYEIEVDAGLKPDSVHVVPMLIQPYVENAIWHGLRHKDGEGRLSISVRSEGEYLSCVIDDNGIGRARAAEIKDQGIPNKPLSSLLNLRRLELLRELYGIAFDVQYIDKPGRHGEDTGTRVILRIPGILNT